VSDLSDYLRWSEVASTPELVEVQQFQETVTRDAYVGPPRDPPSDLAAFRLAFLIEELSELATALGFDGRLAWLAPGGQEVCGGPTPEDRDRSADLPAALDALVDLDYVLKGTVLQLGLGKVYARAWVRVHAANLAKVPGTTPRGYGNDAVKPPGWAAPDLSDLV